MTPDTSATGRLVAAQRPRRAARCGGRSPRRKGTGGERELVELLKAAGIPARRVPLSGSMKASGFGGDVLVQDGDGEQAWEVKRRGHGFKRIEAWLEDAAAVAFRTDRGRWCVCLRLADYLRDRAPAGRPQEAKP